MVTVLEQIELTDTTTSYEVTLDHAPLGETLEQSFEKDRAAREEEGSNELTVRPDATSLLLR